jgi:hypothetical protein
MQVLTSSTPGCKRQMLFMPDINPTSFLFFYERGATGYSYSVRDYSTVNRVTERYAREFGCTADEMRAKAAQVLDAPYMDTSRLADWHAYTVDLNSRYSLPRTAGLPLHVARSEGPAGSLRLFPILNRAALDALPKSAKRGDLRRMFESPQSEDWVTWNLLTLIEQSRPNDWWGHVLASAADFNPHIADVAAMSSATLRFWPRVPSPESYEIASRARMRNSQDPSTVARSADPRPVEGKSEIDVVIENDSVLVYVEAKLNADIEMHTKHDPSRNQIARNIDCLLEAAAGREPMFWMFVRDLSPGRAYAQMIDAYRRDPRTLARDLPHRYHGLIERVARRLAIITWRQLGSAMCQPKYGDDDLTAAVKCELLRRI